jgi:hypothetical protein
MSVVLIACRPVGRCAARRAAGPHDEGYLRRGHIGRVRLHQWSGYDNDVPTRFAPQALGGVVVHGGDESYWLDDRTVAVPWWRVMQRAPEPRNASGGRKDQ